MSVSCFGGGESETDADAPCPLVAHDSLFVELAAIACL